MYRSKPQKNYCIHLFKNKKCFGFLVFLLLHQSISFAQNRGGNISNTASYTGKTYALVIGISDYRELPKLQFADKDATVFASYLKNTLGADSNNVTLITNDEANKVNVLTGLVKIKGKVTKGDKFYFYFAGHGDIETEISNGGILLLADSYKENYYLNSNGFLHQSDLKNIISQITQKDCQVYFITDACHSGSLSGGKEGAEKSMLALKDAWNNENKIFSRQANEVSMEGKQWGNGRGLFSYHLVDGLAGLADEDGDADGKVSLFELQSYLQKYVRKEAAPGKQTPFVVGNLDNNIAEVKPAMLAQVKDARVNNYPVFASVAGRGTAINAFDATTYEAFTNAVSKNQLVMPERNSALFFYNQLQQSKADENSKAALTQKFVSALFDRSTQIINPLLEGEASFTTSTNLATAIKEMDKAIEILGVEHYLSNNLKARKLFLEAAQLTFKEGDEKNAGAIATSIKKLTESIQLEPYAYYSYFQLGYCYNQQKNSAKAIENYNKYLSYLPKSAEAYNNIGVAYYRSADFDKATEYYNKSIALKPTAKAYSNISIVNARLNKFDDANTNFLKAVKLDNTCSYKTGFMIGKACYENKMYDKAQVYLSQSKEANKNYAPPHYYLALCLLNKKDTAKALQYLDQAITLDGQYSYAYDKRGEVYFAKGDYQKAVKDYTVSTDLNPLLWTSYLPMGKAYKELKQYQQQVDAFEKALETDRKLGKVVYLELGNAYRDGLKLYERANAYYQKYIELNQMDDKGYTEAGKNFVAMKNYSAASQHLKKALTLNPANTEAKAVLDGLGATGK